MPKANLKNITIDERQTVNGETFFVIKDNESSQVFFCFQNKLRERWQDLISDRESIREVEIEYEEHERGNKAISLYVNKEGDFLI